MTTEQASKNVEAIVRWINQNVKQMDRYLHYGFGSYGGRRYPNHGREWDLCVKKDGSVEIESVCLKGQFDRFDEEDTRYYPHYTFRKLAEKSPDGANDLMLEWPFIKSKILDEIERLNSLENFQV